MENTSYYLMLEIHVISSTIVKKKTDLNYLENQLIIERHHINNVFEIQSIINKYLEIGTDIKRIKIVEKYQLL